MAFNPVDDQIPSLLEGLHHVTNGIPAEGRFKAKTGPLLVVGRDAGKIVDIEILEDLGLLHGWKEGPSDSASGPGKALRGPADQDGDLLHPRTGDDAVMLASIKQDVFIHLIGKDADVVGTSSSNHIGNLPKLLLERPPLLSGLRES